MCEPAKTLGPLCTALNITTQNFPRNLENLDFEIHCLTFGHMIEIANYVKRSKTSWRAVQDSLAKAFHQDWSGMPTFEFIHIFTG